MHNVDFTTFPRQKIPYSEKTQLWREQCVDSVISLCNAFGRSRRTDNRIKRRNYNLYNNKIDKRDFDYVVNPFNLSKESMKEFQFPATLQPYDIISQYFNLLMGEEMKRPFKPVIRAVNESVLSEKQKQKKDEIMQSIQEIFANPDGSPPDLLLKYQNYTPKDIRESVAEKLYTYYTSRNNLPELFNNCFKDALCVGEEMADVSQIDDMPKVRRVNPMEIYFLLPNNSDKIDEAEKIYERNRLSVSEILDEFYEYLTPEQIADLEDYNQGNTTNYTYGPFMFNITEVDSIYAFEDDYGERGIPVHRTRWKSKKKVGSLHYIDENGEEQETLVDETFKLDKNVDKRIMWLEWFWINEYWEGIRIGEDMYIRIQPRKQQFRSIDNLSTCKSGYVGTVYSATNSQSVSLMDRLVPWVYLYLIIWYRTELAMAKNIGKIALIDSSLIPDTWEPEKWMYYAQAMGFGFINSYNESNKLFGINGMNQSTQNKALDLETGNYIQQHIAMLQFIETKIQDTSGITRQRLGEISSSELVGNTERAVTQSSHVTEPLFYPHEMFKIRVCEAMIDVAKDCLQGKNKVFQYITDDIDTVLFAVDGDEFSLADYGVFISSAAKDQLVLETMKQLMQAALQNDKIQLSSVIDVLNSNSPTDIKHKLIDAEAEMQKQQQEIAQQEQQTQMVSEQERLKFEYEKLDREDENKQLDRENDIRIAELKAIGMDSPTTDNSDTIIEQSKLALEQVKLAHQQSVDNKKLSLEQKKIEAENKRTDVEAKENEKDRQHAKQLEKIKGDNAVRAQKAKPKPKPAAKKK